jgi:polyisoprenyl-phosphate glycosyltransferase
MRILNGWVVIPAFNEEAGLSAFIIDLGRFLGQTAKVMQVRFTILVVNDGSRDRTASVLEEIVSITLPPGISFRHISLIRNFGHQAALIAGLVEASPLADFVITMDADGEHPKALIPEMILAWQKGDSIVHTVRRPHRQLTLFKRLTSSAYYQTLRWLSGLEVQSGMADFKLWDGETIRQVKAFLPQCGSTRSFASWLAPHGRSLTYDQLLVQGRKSRFTLRKMLSLALNSIVRYSDLPLRVSLFVGVVALLFSAIWAGFVIWATLTNRTVTGWASTIMTILIFGGLQSFAIGILGEYVLRNWFRHSLPKYVVARSKNLSRQDDRGVDRSKEVVS